VDAWYCTPLSLFSIMSSNTGELPGNVKNNSIMFSRLRIWCDITKHTGRRDFSSALQPLIDNKAFAPGIGMSIFNEWYLNELRFVSDLFQNGNLMSYKQIQNKFKIQNNHFFGFHFEKSHLIFPNDQPILRPIESFLNDKKLISFSFLMENFS